MNILELEDYIIELDKIISLAEKQGKPKEISVSKAFYAAMVQYACTKQVQHLSDKIKSVFKGVKASISYDQSALWEFM